MSDCDLGAWPGSGLLEDTCGALLQRGVLIPPPSGNSIAGLAELGAQ